MKAGLNILPRLTTERVTLAAAWRKCVSVAREAANLWGRAKGPISSLIITALQNHWDPQLPRQWKAPHGEEFYLLPSEAPPERAPFYLEA
eukprot:6343632-Pyramimonas_sp.AAC.1